MHTYPSSINGIVFMLINTMALACIDAISKTLTKDLSSEIVVFCYKFSLLIIILPWILSGGLKVFKTKRLKFHFFRSILSVFASICFYKGLQTVNMGEAAILENIQYLLVSIVGIIFFNEKATKGRVFAIILGTIGASIVMNPSLLDFGWQGWVNKSAPNIGHVYILCAMGAWAMNTVTIKILGTTESNKTQMFYLLFFASIVGGIVAMVHWSSIEVAGYSLKIQPSLIDLSSINLEAQHIKFLLMMAALYFIHGISYFNALKFDLSLVIPFRYSKMVFSGMLGYFLFNEVQHDPRSYVGYAIIIVASLTLLQEEVSRKLQSRRKKNLETQESNRQAKLNLSS